MVQWYRCHGCNKVTIITPERGNRCPFCGFENGDVLSQERVKEGMEAGAIWNIDPTTGKRAKEKKKPRR
jgi:DNA-directed RNA polymerase subunit RPC12/RpoP